VSVISATEKHAKRQHTKALREMKAVQQQDLLSLKKEQRRYRQEVKKTVPNDLLYIYAKTKKEKERRKEKLKEQRTQNSEAGESDMGPDPPSWIPPPPSTGPPPAPTHPSGLTPQRSTSSVLPKKRDKPKMDSRTKSTTPRSGGDKLVESARRARSSKNDSVTNSNSFSTSLPNPTSPKEKKSKKKIEMDDSSCSISMVGLESSQDFDRKKTTDEFLQFIEDPSVDERKNLKIKEPINKSLESCSDIQTPLQNVSQKTPPFSEVNLTEDDNQNSAVPSLPDTVTGPESLL